MKKRRILLAVLVLATITACLAGGKYYIFREKNERILSLEVPPFADEITVFEGETSYENYFEIIYENGFSYRDIEFVSENNKVATVKYSVTDRNRYVCFKVEGKSPGETNIYFTANSGETVSDKIKVTVLQKKTDIIQTTAAATETAEVIASEVEYTESRKTEENTRNTAVTESTSASDKSTTGNNTDKNYGNTVYITPTGKRYHYSKSCAGKNGKAVTKSVAIENGKTPCKKCAGG